MSDKICKLGSQERRISRLEPTDRSDLSRVRFSQSRHFNSRISNLEASPRLLGSSLLFLYLQLYSIRFDSRLQNDHLTVAWHGMARDGLSACLLVCLFVDAEPRTHCSVAKKIEREILWWRLSTQFPSNADESADLYVQEWPGQARLGRP